MRSDFLFCIYARHNFFSLSLSILLRQQLTLEACPRHLCAVLVPTVHARPVHGRFSSGTTDTRCIWPQNSGRRVNSSLCFVQLTLQWSQGSVLLSSAGMNIALTNTGVLAVRQCAYSGPSETHSKLQATNADSVPSLSSCAQLRGDVFSAAGSAFHHASVPSHLGVARVLFLCAAAVSSHAASHQHVAPYHCQNTVRGASAHPCCRFHCVALGAKLLISVSFFFLTYGCLENEETMYIDTFQ